MTLNQTLVLFGVGVPLLVGVVMVADARGAFRNDTFATIARKRAALALLVFVLAISVLLPVASAPPTDARQLRFANVFTGHAALLLFLGSWWLLSGRPPLRDFLALRSRNPLLEAGAGISLGLIGWTLTLLVGLVVGFLLSILGVPGPGIPPLVRWIAALPAWQKGLIVLAAMTVEELHFRAFLQRRVGPVAASLLFLLSHGGYGEPFFFVGLLAITAVLAASFQYTGSTVAPMLAHGVFNAVQLFIVLPLVLRLLGRA